METETSCWFAPPGPLDCRVLLVEDDRDHQMLLSLMLERAGAEVAVAENGREAVELVRAACEAGCGFDLVVMDLKMPVLDGLTATRVLRSRGFDKPIIALTARAVSTDRQRSFAAGCNDFLSKPVSRDELIGALASHLAQTRAHQGLG